MQDLSGKTVIITGASRGIGAAAARVFAAQGANVMLLARTADEIIALADEIGPNAMAAQCDVSQYDALEAAVTACTARFGGLDVLINNAGALFNDYYQTAEGIEVSVALLLLSPWRLTEALHPLLAGHDTPARVINVVSGGMYTQKLECKSLVMSADDYRGSVAYARAKRALTVLTELWAARWQDDDIVVNAMHPGWADTPGVQGALPGFRRLTQRVLRSSQEGADTIVWLARAREADTISGQLFLDREPRTTHLRQRTLESAEERAALQPWLTQTYATLDLTEST